MDNTVKKRVNFLITITYWAVVIALVYFTFKYFINLIMPFFLALILAAAARPIALALSRKTRVKKGADGSRLEVPRKIRLNYNVAVIVSIILLLLLLAGLITLIAVPVISYLISKISELPGLYTNVVSPALQDLLFRLNDYTDNLEGPLANLSVQLIPNLTSYLGSFVANASTRVLSWASSLATSLPSVLIKGLITLIASIFIALDFDSIKSFTKNNMTEHVFSVFSKITASLVTTVTQFIRSYFLIFLITMAEIALGLFIIGTDRPLFFAILIAVFDAFPIVGSGMILMPWAVFSLITGNVLQGLGLLILFIIVVVIRQIIEPKIVGRHVGLKPIVTLICMYVGNRLFGGLGLFGLPIAAAIITDLNSQENGVHLFNNADKPSESA